VRGTDFNSIVFINSFLKEGRLSPPLTV